MNKDDSGSTQINPSPDAGEAAADPQVNQATLYQPAIAAKPPPAARPGTSPAGNAQPVDPQANQSTLYQPAGAANPRPASQSMAQNLSSLPQPVGRQATAAAQQALSLPPEGATLITDQVRSNTGPQLTPPPISNTKAPSKR